MSPRIEKSVPDGPSTSPEVTTGHCVPPIKRSSTMLDKHGLANRVARRAAQRYCQSFTASQLDELINECLVDEAVRHGNDGQRPIYLFGHTSYRRALQIVRFRQMGITGRDDIRLMLFVRGYGFPARKIGEVLLRAHTANSRKLTAQVRSGYVDNTKAIPEKHRASLLAQMGPLDETLDAGGLKFHPDTMIDLLRVAKQGAVVEVAAPEANRSFFRKLFSPTSPLVGFAKKVFSGLLNLGADDEDAGPRIDTVARLIRSASDVDLQNAREFHRLQVWLLTWMAVRVARFGSAGRPLSAALRKIGLSLRDDPKWAALILVIGLRILRFDADFKNTLNQSRKKRKFVRSE